MHMELGAEAVVGVGRVVDLGGGIERNSTI